MSMYIHNPVANAYLAHLIFGIGKKVIDDEIGQAFIKKAVKDGLHAFTARETTKKIPQVGKPQPMYFAVKGNSEKLSE